jgi:hypothetical protein
MRNKCRICNRHFPRQLRGLTCGPCRTVMSSIHTAKAGDAAGPPHPELEERLRKYEDRAARGLPLFT